MKAARNKKVIGWSVSQAVAKLPSLRLLGLLQGTAVWLPVDHATASLVHQSGFGSVEGGQATAESTAEVLRAAGGLGNNVQDLCICIMLSLEEALFLLHSLQAITVYASASPSEPAQKLSAEDLWQWCMQLRRNFLGSYVAFRHFREKGWIARSGLQYGADLVLYENHPAASHSQFCILVTLVGKPQLPLKDVEIANRLCTAVGKKLLLLYIALPSCSNSSGIACLKSATVEERILSRWVPDAGL